MIARHHATWISIAAIAVVTSVLMSGPARAASTDEQLLPEDSAISVESATEDSDVLSGPTIPDEGWVDGTSAGDSGPAQVELGFGNAAAEPCEVPSADLIESTCITMAPLQSDVVASLAVESAASPVPIPDNCIQGALDADLQTSQVLDLRRFGACTVGVLNGTISRLRNGVPIVVGTVSALIINFSYTARDQRTWGNQIEIRPSITTGRGSTATYQLTPSCVGDACKKAGDTSPSQTATVGTAAVGESFWRWPTTGVGTRGGGLAGWTLILKSGIAASNPAFFEAEQVRCDSVYKPAGCVFPANTPFLRYDGGRYPTFGSHVSQAQESGLPGSQFAALPVPLHRADSAVREANRAVACLPARAGGPVRPEGLSCDEYPFASAVEGAAAAGPTGRRTFDGCQYPSLPTGVVGPVGWSGCMISNEENSRAGSALETNLYRPFRIIEGDAFWVDVLYPT